MRVVALVQARLGSSRLPGKALLSLSGRTVLGHVLERALAVEGVDEVGLATSESPRDQALCGIAWGMGVRSVLGSEWDVLGRMREAAEWFKADVVMRVTGDCPFLAPEVSALVLRTFMDEQRGVDYVSNDTSRSGYPDGLDTEVFSIQALRLAHRYATKQQDREHVTGWMRRELHCGMVACADGDWTALKLSVDKPEDFDLALRMHRHLPPGSLSFQATLAAYASAQETMS